mgnify:CR=1 FL=1
MIIIRRLIALLLLLWIALLSGCSDSGSFVLRMDLQGPVHNLDPQFATEDAARMILLNLGEGLMIRDGEGLSLGVALSCTLSEDGLTYEFLLREDACWQDGQPVLASQFVYAFQRMFAPGAASPNAQQFRILEGAEAILSGQGTLQDLGVTATDQSRVVFRLAQSSPAFLELLAIPSALPCREDFFTQSRGRYGLERSQVLSNGPFVLSRWDNEGSIRLERNDAYVSPRGLAKPERIVLYIGRDDPVAQYLNGKSDLLWVLPHQRQQVEGKGELTEWENRVWCILFNQNSSLWENPLLRQSLACTIDSSLYQTALNPGLRSTGLLIPPTPLWGGSVQRQPSQSSGPIAFDPRQGKRLLTLGLEAQGVERIPSTALQAPEEFRDALNTITQGWQQHLNLSIYPEPASLSSLTQRLESGEFQLMLYPFTLDTGPDSLLDRFSSASRVNFSGYHSPRFDEALKAARTQANPSKAWDAYAAAEEILLRDVVVIPLFWETTAYLTAPKISGIQVTPAGTVLFHSASKAG